MRALSRAPVRLMVSASSPNVRSFAKYLLAGCVGFAVDGTLLTLLVVHADWSPWHGRLVSFPAAVTVTWWINRRYAFQGRGEFRRHAEYAAYFGIQLVGAAVNLGVFGLCLWMFPALVRWPVVPLAVGAGVALVFNFVAARSTLYRRSCSPSFL